MKHYKLDIIDDIEIYTPLKESYSNINIFPGDIIITENDDGSPYGVSGAVYATQYDTSHQIELKNNLISLKDNCFEPS